jgi:hypothetical protein
VLLRVLLLSLACGSVFAQAFPVSRYASWSAIRRAARGDFTTRLVADEMAKELGVAVIADNRPGAGGNIAAEIVAKAPADGYTLLNAWHHAINIALYKSANYQEKDFAAVCRVATGATVLVVNNSQPFNNLRELIDYARRNPGKLFNASCRLRLRAAARGSPVRVGRRREAHFGAVQGRRPGRAVAARRRYPGDVRDLAHGDGLHPRRTHEAARDLHAPRVTRHPGIPGAEEAGLPDTITRSGSASMRRPALPRRSCAGCTKPLRGAWQNRRSGKKLQRRGWTRRHRPRRTRSRPSCARRRRCGVSLVRDPGAKIE